MRAIHYFLAPGLLLSLAFVARAGVRVSGELRTWHKVTMAVDGPRARESDTAPNPFLDYRMSATFVHESGLKRVVPGYFAADGDAAQTSADEGNKWRVHLSPDKPGKWTYEIAFHRGPKLAVDPAAKGEAVGGADGLRGEFHILPSDKSGRDLRAKGRLEYVGKRYLRFAGNGEHFLKIGADSPENLLAYIDFDGTSSHKRRTARAGEAVPTDLKSWAAHIKDWRAGDPVWKDGKGKGLIGALNYLSSQGVNAFSFLTYNAGGDGDDVWPFISRDDKLHYDCSKLDQWQMVFDHAQSLGLYLHFKMQETENDDNRSGNKTRVPESLDGGDLGVERKLYCRELIARFSHELALNWNLGEENTQTPEQQQAMAQYIRSLDPYGHHIVIHTYPNEQDKVYTKLVGQQSVLTGASLQNSWSSAHQRTLKWVTESQKAGRPWVVANDEQGPAGLGVPPDPGYRGFDGKAREKETDKPYDLHDIRKATLWGTLMAGGAGVEYYFGYKLPENDLKCEDWRSRERSWQYARIAVAFFDQNQIPFWEMDGSDALVGNAKSENSRYCLGKPGEVYVIYLPSGGNVDLDLSKALGGFTVQWFNPREGGALKDGAVKRVSGGGTAKLGTPPTDASEDWVILVRKAP